MLAKVLMKELAETKARVNEVLLYSAFGWGDAERKNTVTGEDIGRYVAYLVSDAGSDRRGETLHLRTADDVGAGSAIQSSSPQRHRGPRGIASQ
jgi:hypothetical protein